MEIHPIFKDNLTFLLSKTAAAVRGEFAEYLKGLDLIPPQKGIMTLLRQEGESNQYNLCHSLGINKATMVRHLDDLQEKKFITRKESTHDRREKLVSLTKKGLKVLDTIEKKNWEIEEVFFKDLSQKETETLKKLLLKLHTVKDL